LLGRPWPAAGEPLFLPQDTNWHLALAEHRAREKAERCRLCGLPKKVCRDQANQFRFEVEAERCHATYALMAAQERVKGSDVSLRATDWSARLPRD
jgi:hypothetical protein